MKGKMKNVGKIISNSDLDDFAIEFALSLFYNYTFNEENCASGSEWTGTFNVVHVSFNFWRKLFCSNFSAENIFGMKPDKNLYMYQIHRY